MILRNTAIDKLKYLLKIPSALKSIDHAEIVLRAREILADTITPYRWSDEQLTDFADDGVSEIKTLRADVDLLTDVPCQFTSALSNYVVYRAFALDNDAQNNNGAISDKYLNIFREQSDAVKYFFTDEKLNEFADDAVDVIISRRPELRLAADGTLKNSIVTDTGYDLPERFTDVIVSGAAASAAAHAKNEMAQYFSEQFTGALQSI